MNPIAYRTHPAAVNLFDTAPLYTKAETTALRRVLPEEVGLTLITYKANSDATCGFVREIESVLSEDHIIACNTKRQLGFDEAGIPVYNTWAISSAVVEKNYGDAVLSNLTTVFQEHRKKATLRAVPLDEALLKAFGVAQGEPLAISVSWSLEPMIAHEGDYITDQGYSISKTDIVDYVLV